MAHSLDFLSHLLLAVIVEAEVELLLVHQSGVHQVLVLAAILGLQQIAVAFRFRSVIGEMVADDVVGVHVSSRMCASNRFSSNPAWAGSPKLLPLALQLPR